MKSIISCILLLSSFLAPAIAQTNLRNDYEKLTAYTRMVELVDEDSLKSAYINSTKILVQEKMQGQDLSDSVLLNITSVILINKYQASQEFLQRTRDLKPYIDQYMTENEVLSLVKDLDYAKNRKLGISFDNYISAKEQEQIVKDLKEVILKYMNEEECTAPATAKCPNEFRKTFMLRYENILKPYIAEVIERERKAAGDFKYRLEAIGKAQEYMLANYHEILLSNYASKYQLNDIRTMNSIAFGDATQKALKVVETVRADRKAFADKCIESHIAYVKKLDVSYNSEGSASELKIAQKETRKPAPQREYKGNCLSVEVKAGQLSDLLKGVDLSKYDGLKIIGTLNTADVRTIRALYGAEKFYDPTLRDSLLLLDLSDAKFKKDKSAYFNENATQKGIRMTRTTTTTVTRYENNWKWGAPQTYTNSTTFDFSAMTEKEWERFKAVIGTEYNDQYFVKDPDGDYYVYYFVSNKHFPSAMMRGCSSLQCIILPKKCKEFDQDAVSDCDNLKVVAYNKNTKITYRNQGITKISQEYDQTFVYEP